MNKYKILASILMLFVLSLSNSALGQERNYINARSATESDALPFSGAVQVGETLYLSGMIGLVNGH